jgi:uncharacterized membrane protein YkoI
MKARIRLLIFPLMILMTTGTVWAQHLRPRPPERVISPGEAASAARQQHGGQVLSSELVRPPGERPYYRVKIIENGKVRTVRVNAGGG